MPHTALSLVGIPFLTVLFAGLMTASRAAALPPDAPVAAPDTQPAEDPELELQVIGLIARMSDPDGNVRDAADVTLRNLPVSAFPVIERVVGTVKDALSPEAAARLGQYRQMYARLAVRERERLAEARWIRRQLINAYDDSAHRKAAWDADARQAVLLATQSYRSDRDEARLLDACRKAQVAGADDPVFLYCAATVDQRHSDMPPRQLFLPMLQAARMLADERRSPAVVLMFRCDAMAIASKSPADRGCIEISAARSLSLHFGLGREDEHIPPALLYRWAWQILDPALDNAVLMQEARRVLEPLRRMIPGSVYPVLLEAVAYRNAASSGFASIENRPGHDPARSRRDEFLQAADELFARASNMDPMNPMIARERMLFYVQSGRDDEADKCYRAAMAADPDDIVTATRRLDTLGAGQLDFARGLLEQENWRAGLPFLLVECHAEQSRFAGDNLAYFARPDVKADIQAVYQKYLRLFPKDVFRRSEYARYMALCQMWPEADRQMRELGENWSPRVFGSRMSFEFARAKAAKLAAVPPGPRNGASTERAIP